MTARDPATLLRLKPEAREKLKEVAAALGLTHSDTVARLVLREHKRLNRKAVAANVAKWWETV
jgi:hypothetical protein